jgi:branched-chain amino acid transport system ATP-binding protein
MGVLAIRDLDVYYGAIHALRGVTLEVGEHEIVTLIGANGAGKSTLLRAISGLLRGRAGSITYQGRPIQNLAAHRIVEAGLIQVPEGRRIFANMTVLENLELGAYLRVGRARVASDLRFVFALFPRLEERCMQNAGTLSGGEQQMLAMGRALMAQPQLLLLDEPSMGLAPLLVKEIFDVIERINEENGTTILLVEQNAHMALQVARRAYVLETGQVTMEGEAAALARDERVKKAYLGI